MMIACGDNLSCSLGCTVKKLTDIFAYLMEYLDGRTQVSHVQVYCHGIGPGSLPLQNIVKCCTAFGCNLHQLGAAMKGVLAIKNEAFLLQAVRRLLNTLAGKTHTACDMGDRNRAMLDNPQHLPTRTAQSGGMGELIACFQQQPVGAKDLDHKFGKGIALQSRYLHMTGLYHIDSNLSILSFRRPPPYPAYVTSSALAAVLRHHLAVPRDPFLRRAKVVRLGKHDGHVAQGVQAAHVRPCTVLLHGRPLGLIGVLGLVIVAACAV